MTTAKTTTNIKFCGKMTSAYAQRIERTDGTMVAVVRVYDDIAGHYVIPHSLTSAQERRVISRAMND